MSKPLSEMSKKELWQLFPIILSDHQDAWKAWYEEEEAQLRQILPMEQVCRICHVGSTAVPAIKAKPTIDIHVEKMPQQDNVKLRAGIESLGYRCMFEDDNRPVFCKGYTEQGFAKRVYHLHLRNAADNDELYFRDYLLAHPEVALDYEKLKTDLGVRYKHNRDAYTDSKTDFIKHYTKIAKEEYAGRYL